MSVETFEPVAVSRRIEATAHVVFAVLADPVKHLELDGSGMLRGAVTDGVVTKFGDVFVMKMYYPELGNYEMNNHVVEYELDRRIGWEPVAGRGHPDEFATDARWGHRWTFDLAQDGPASTIVTEIYDCSGVPAKDRESMQGGRIWIESMAATLERLDAVCSRSAQA